MSSLCLLSACKAVNTFQCGIELQFDIYDVDVFSTQIYNNIDRRY